MPFVQITQSECLNIYTSQSCWKISKVVSLSSKCSLFHWKLIKTCCFFEQGGKLIWQLTIEQESTSSVRSMGTMDWMFCLSCNIVKNIQSWLEESPLMFNYCLQGERLFCYVQASFVTQYYYEITYESDRLAYGIN